MAETSHVLAREYKALIENLLELRGAGEVIQMVRGIDKPGQRADLAGYSPDLSLERKVEILDTLDVEQRLKKLIEWTREILADASLKDKIRNEVQEGMEKRQREFLLRQQMEAIKKELGESDGDVAAEYRKKIEDAGMPEAVRKEVERELDRFERTSEQNPEAGWIRNYLDWMLDIPWNKRTVDQFDVVEARRVLDEDHTGLEDVKDRIIEFLAVGNDWRGDPSSALLEVLDPAQNHSFRDHYLEVDLDLSEVLFIPTANVADTIPGPLLDRMEIIRLDGYTEEEKLAIARDHLLRRQLDRNGLSNDEVMVDDEALRRIIADHTREAGVRNLERELGRLLRKVATQIEAGKVVAPVNVGGEAVKTDLGRAKFHAEVAERTEVPGVATGLAVTGIGGEVLFVEAAAMDGQKGLTLTGQLGDVMKESAQIGLSYVRSHATALGIAPGFEEKAIHVHVPAGAIPKDGPSAGVTMVTALVSLFSGRPVKSTVGMTGEVTLQGKVLPIGGVKQKLLAAHRAGLTEVILPYRNEADLDDLPQSVREAMTIHLASDVRQVLDWALEPKSVPLTQAA